MTYLRGTRSAQTALIAHLRSVSMWIKFNFNYRWVRSQVLTFGWICATTPQPKKQGKMVRAAGRDKSWLVTCLDPSWTCACRACSSCLVRWSSPATETQTQLCPCEQRSRTGKCGHPSCEGEPTHRKADELGNWACKWNLGVCQLAFLRGPNV